jgi:outer membrane protein OmpA-like peptidoglycan-associated protein
MLMKPATIYGLTRLFLSICLIAFIGCARKTMLQGRILIAEQKLPYLVHQDILLKRDQRTAYTTKIDKYGFFEFRDVKKRNNYSIEFDSLPKTLDGTVFYIANLNGKKIKEINLRKEFSFRLLPVEFNALMAMQDDDLEAMIKAFKNNASVNELLVKKFINYETGSFLISKENRKYLNTMAGILKKNEQFMLKVNSHADAIGDDQFNLALSVKRANEIKSYLVAKGISEKRIFTFGYGETRPLNNCTNGVACSELQHKQNRRTEFVFTTHFNKKSPTEIVVD